MEELRGVLAVGVLPETLRRIFIGRRSGSLHLAFGIERSDVGFIEGYLTQVETSLPGARLGDLLVQIGFLSARDRDACLEIAALSGERIGETLLRHGIMEPDHLAQGLALQLREVLARTLVWDGGVYTFTDHPPVSGETPPGGFAVPRLDPREVILDATWTLVGDRAIDALLGDLSRKVRKVVDERLSHLDFRLATADAFLLSRVDGVLTAESLLQMSALHPQEAKASLAGLLAVGAIEYAGAPAPTSMTTEAARSGVALLAARIGSSDPFEVLGVASDASNEELRSAYLKLARSCDPAATADLELRPMFRHMSSQLTSAFKEIESRRGAFRPGADKQAVYRQSAPAPPAPSVAAPRPPLRPALPARPPSTPPRASVALSKGAGQPRPVAPAAAPVPTSSSPAPALPQADPLRAVKASIEAADAGRLHEALLILHEAIPHLAGQARRAARVRRARVLLAVENGARLAEEELKSAISEDPGNAEAHAALGGIYRERGSLALATMEYRKALELQPRNTIAREALAELTSAAAVPAPEPSALRRMFGQKPPKTS